jgi:hypothetical protein
MVACPHVGPGALYPEEVSACVLAQLLQVRRDGPPRIGTEPPRAHRGCGCMLLPGPCRLLQRRQRRPWLPAATGAAARRC